MDWLTENWLWIVFGAVFLSAHLRMHGGHGAHAEHGGHGAVPGRASLPGGLAADGAKVKGP